MLRKPVVVLLCLLLAGCAGLPSPQPPSVALERVELMRMSMTEQRFRLTLDVGNPNAVALPLTGIRYRLEVDGTELGAAASDQTHRLPAGEQTSIALELTVDSVRLLGQLSHWARDPSARVPYVLHTEVDLGAWPQPLTITHEGHADLRVAADAFAR